MKRPMLVPPPAAFAVGMLCFANLAAGQTSEVLPSTVFDWETRVVRETDVGQWRGVTDSPTATLTRLESHITTLNPGLESHPQHQHPQEEFVILKEGLLDVVINGEAHRAEPGALFFFAANDFHSVSNVGDEPATYLVFNYETAKTRGLSRTPAAESAPPEMLRSAVFPWRSAPAQTRGEGQVRRLFDAPTVTARNLECYAVTLPPRAQADEGDARLAQDALVIVMEGQVETEMGGDRSVVGPGSILFFASGDSRALRNAGEGDASYYVVRMASDATPES